MMFRSLWLSLILLSSMNALAGSTNTVLITESTLAALPQCLHYQVKGVCYWLTDTGITVTTPYVAHFLPDLVVSSFNPPTDKNGGNPWLEINETLDQAGEIAEKEIISAIAHTKAGGGQHGFENPLQQNVYFKEVDVIGNPALTVLPSTPALLPSTAIPLKPYFQSMLDSALWRGFSPQAEPEQADAVIEDTTHYVGSNASAINWGGAFPFEGKVETTNDAKAAAVIVQRASNLLTAQNSWAHVYQSLPTHCGQECDAAVIQEDSDNTQFQLVYPIQQSSCQVFGKSSNYGENFEQNTHGGYVWVLWRHYQGCIQTDGKYIGKIVVN
ncbi:MAG TPA: TIGR03756 family integrating conjugative element protein [Gammaproteobacteria bacterium]|nr:TIGR03756 family integrating conjugative element protein [Gammaproteobacteria bacterium]HVY54092.1 TIGR03756 family integrating conjugative element protein [Gammaproteobacteria bacterium]